MSSHQPFHEYYHRQHARNDDEEQASANNRIRPSLRMSESWYPSWVSSDEDSSSLETGSGIITPQLIYEQRKILMDIEEKKRQEEGYGKNYPAFEKMQQPYQPSVHSAQDRFLLLQRGESSNGSITSMEEDKSILNHSVRMYMEIDESGSAAPPVLNETSVCENSFEQELNHVHCNMDPFRDEEEESYPHHRIHFHPGSRPDVEDPANEITRSTHHSAQPIPLPSELPSRHPLPPQRPTPHLSHPIEATLVDEQQQQQQQQDVGTLRTQIVQDLEESKVFRKSLQEETERLRNRIMEMEEQEPKGGSCSRRMKICCWASCLLILVSVVLVANWMLYGGKGLPFFGKEASTVTSDASSGINVTVSPSSSPTTNSLDPGTMTPTCQRPDMSPFFGGGSYRTKSGRLDGRHDVRCKKEMSTRMLIVLVASAADSCQVECVGYLLPSDYSRQCPSNRATPLANATSTLPAAIAPMGGGGGGGGSHSSTPDVHFILAGDYRNEILYLGYASSDFDLDCSQKLIMV